MKATKIDAGIVRAFRVFRGHRLLVFNGAVSPTLSIHEHEQ